MNADKTMISGTWSQGQPFPLVFERTSEAGKRNPQRICRNARATRAAFHWFWMFPLHRSRSLVAARLTFATNCTS